jgi:hypothetical protein
MEDMEIEQLKSEVQKLEKEPEVKINSNNQTEVSTAQCLKEISDGLYEYVEGYLLESVKEKTIPSMPDWYKSLKDKFRTLNNPAFAKRLLNPVSQHWPSPTDGMSQEELTVVAAEQIRTIGKILAAFDIELDIFHVDALDDIAGFVHGYVQLYRDYLIHF